LNTKTFNTKIALSLDDDLTKKKKKKKNLAGVPCVTVG
jgi:hypothetical protein